MLNRIETMQPMSKTSTVIMSTNDDADDNKSIPLRQHFLSKVKPVRRKRQSDKIGSDGNIHRNRSSIKHGRDEHMEAPPPMPAPKRLRRCEKIEPPKQLPKTYNNSMEPWWMRIQIGGETDRDGATFDWWEEVAEDMDNWNRENDYVYRSTSITTVGSTHSNGSNSSTICA